MPRAERSLRVFHAPEGFCDVMFRANLALLQGNAGEAIQKYTKVLYKLSPGHVCALLNRSMAYVEWEYYELAVVDAYRACVAVNELRKMTPITAERLSKIAKYIKAERLHVDGKEQWTLPRHRNIGMGWQRSPLASIVINATPEVTVPGGVRVPAFGTSRVSLVRALEIRATYRLCGTLLMIGEGARKDALDIIDDARSRMGMSQWESKCFDRLGNEIMDKLVSDVDPNDPKDIRALGQDTKDKRNERMRRLVEAGKATTTHSSYGDYPWDLNEPKLRESDWQKKVQAWAEGCSEKCSALVIEPEDSDDTPSEGTRPYVELRANRDIDSGDLVLSEQSISNVTTSMPDQIEEKRRAGILDHYYCNSCASLLSVPQQCPHKFQTTQNPAEPEPIPPATPTASPLTRSSQSSNNTTQDFMFCHPNHMIPTCSAACRALSHDFDSGICQTNIEQKVRRSYFTDFMPRSMADRKTQCLRDLVFLRQISMAMNLNESPLENNDLEFATSGPNMRDIENSEVELWSFVSHVVRPIRYLTLFFESSNTDQFLKLSQLDGWIINTLLVKINRVMRISKSPRYVKCFQADGMLDTAFGPWDERWDALTKPPQGEEDESVWIASIDSLFNLIRIADPTKGEIPNVAVIQREGVKVYAAKTDGGPAIKAGEPLLRAADGVEGPVLDELLYAENLAESMEETRDGEGVHSGNTSDFNDYFSAHEDLEDANGADDAGNEPGDTMEVDPVDAQLFH